MRSSLRITRKERRRDRRRDVQFEAALGGYLVTLTDVSAAGFGVAIDATEKMPYDFRVGQRLRLEIERPGGGLLSLQVEIVREARVNGVLGGVFLNLSDAEYNLIESLVTGRLQRRR